MPIAIQAPPTTRAPSCSTTTLTQARIEKSAPSTAGTGIAPRPTFSETGTRKALGRPLSR